MSPPACSGRKGRLATNPFSAPERREDAAARRPYLALAYPLYSGDHHMLWLAHDGKLRQVVPASDDVSDGRPAPRAESEQGLERCHGCLAPIMTKDELVEINLQLMSANAVVRSEEPLLKIPDGTVGERHRRLGPFAEILSRWLHALHMSIACLTQTGK